MSKQCQKLKTFFNNSTKLYVVCWPLRDPVPFFFLLAYRSLAKIHLDYICWVKAKRMQTTESDFIKTVLGCVWRTLSPCFIMARLVYPCCDILFGHDQQKGRGKKLKCIWWKIQNCKGAEYMGGLSNPNLYLFIYFDSFVLSSCF